MSDVDKAFATQIENLQKRSGKTLKQFETIIRSSGLQKHGEIREMLKNDLGMGHGDANTVATLHLKPATPAWRSAEGGVSGEAADAIYVGPKASLRPIHDKFMAGIKKFGEFEIAPKKTYVSLRRKKQFAMIGPATNTRVEVGINCKELKSDERLLENPPNSMSPFKVKISSPLEVDATLLGWVKKAFDGAG